MTRPRILVIDDDEDVLRSTTRMLRAAGFEVVGTTSPVEALERLLGGDRAFAALITDVYMPALGGPELVARVEEAGISIPTLYLSGDDAPPVVGHPVLAKPFSRRLVVEALAELGVFDGVPVSRFS
ncbi:MAG: response regulator [Proteobacteria bacterium]|nr:response regulator [Pseudomonadota bacterium]